VVVCVCVCVYIYIYIYNSKKLSHYRLEVPRGFQEVKVPRLRDNGQNGGKVISLTPWPFLPHTIFLVPI